MKYLKTLASFVPDLIVQQLKDEPNASPPFRQTYETVCVFCDISGFTKLSEFMAKSGKGAEGVSRNLNKYFQVSEAITRPPYLSDRPFNLFATRTRCTISNTVMDTLVLVDDGQDHLFGRRRRAQVRR